MTKEHLAQQIQDDDYEFPYHYIPQFSPGYSQTYSWPWGIYYVSAMEFILEKLRELTPVSIADVGTGDGRLVREIARAVSGAKVIGIDYSDRAIKLAQALNPGLDFRCIDVVRDGLDANFEVVTLIEVFEHIPPHLTSEFVTAVRSLVQDDGYLIVTVPHKNVHVPRKHFQHFTVAGLESAFERHFSLDEVVCLDTRSPVVDWIKKLLENKYFILTHWGIRNRLYLLYKRFYLKSVEQKCGRIYMRFRPKLQQ